MNRTPKTSPHPAPRRRRALARRGVAMMMVLSVIAVASVLSWAMLSSSSMRSQVDVNAADSVEANNLAESGVSYALNYLRHPDRSPVVLAQGAFDRHYPGQTGLMLWSDAGGTVDVTVTNTAQHAFTIRSTSSVDGTTRTVEADATLKMRSYPITSAGGFNGPFTVPASMQINGPVIARGAVGGATGQITNSPAIVPAGANVVPTAAEVVLLNETGVAAVGTGVSTDRTYTYNGRTYIAERAPSTIVATRVPRSTALNPCNVWYSDADVTLSDASFTGVLVMRGAATLKYSGTNSITAPPGMPALVVNNIVDVKSVLVVPAKLTVTGAAYVGNKVTAITNNRSDALFKVDGALLMGGAAPMFQSVAAQVRATYVPANVSGVNNFSTTRFIEGVTIRQWRSIE